MHFAMLFVFFAIMFCGCASSGGNVSSANNKSKVANKFEKKSPALQESSEQKARRLEKELIQYLQEDPHLSVRYNNSSSAIVIVIRSGDLFLKDSADISSVLTLVLDRIVTKLVTSNNYEIKVVGHTDNYGDSQFNLMVSEKRAETVKAYLISKGINASSITTEGKGSLEPIVSNFTSEGRNVNRRVDLVIRFLSDRKPTP